MSFIPESEVKDTEILFRAIHPSFWEDEEDRVSSALFKDRKGVSVDRDGERDENESIEFLLNARDNYGAGKLNAGETINIGTYIKPNKIPENDFHALILESKSKIKLSDGKAKKLSRMMTVIISPTKTESK
jgi:hypothetical protein